VAEDKVARKLTTILAADVVGYSRLMGADEEATARTFKSYRQAIDRLIAKHQGRVFGGAGDSVIAEFASPVEAVRCAVEFQRDVETRNAELEGARRMRFRIGVNLGDVMIEGDDLLGDGVNVAARMEAIAEPGGICVSRPVFTQVKGKLDLGFADLGPQKVKNIAEPVPTYKVLLDAADAGKVIPAKRKVTMSRPWSVGSIAMLLLIVVTVAAWWRPWVLPPTSASLAGKAIPLPKKPSIAVMPFANLTGSASQDYFADGITEDIVNRLGRYRPIAVLAFNAARPHRNSQLTPAQVGRALGVRYIVVGSIRRRGRRVRVSARLIDAQNGVLQWSKQFDEESDDIFAIQDAIARHIAGTLLTNVRRLEQRRAVAKPTENLDAYDLVLRGRVLLLKATRSNNRKARLLLEQAIQLDANYALAYAWLARAHYLTVSDGWTEFPARSLKRAEELAQKALSIDADVVEAHRTLGRVYAIQFQYGRAIAEIDQAIALNPSDAEAHGDRGLILLYLGRLKESVAALETAFEFDPHLAPDYFYARGLAYYTLRRHSDAVQILERGAARYPKYVYIAVVLVAAYGQLGRIDDAERNAIKVKRLLPIFDPVTFGTRFKNHEHYKYLAEGLRKGGLK